MSAPDTNVDKQVKRHKPSLGGIIIALLIAVVAVVVFAFWDDLSPADEAAPATVTTETN